MSDSVAQAKKLLRNEMKALRAACGDRAARDERVCARFFSLPASEKRSFFIYNAFSNETATAQIAARLLREGKAVCFPRTEGREMVAVRWQGQATVKGAFGIEEPVGEPYGGEIDVCVLPLLAADGQFYRLGYGGGFYDRFLTGKKIYKVGICYDFQIVGRVPREPHDVRLAALVTDARTMIRR